MRRVQVVDGVVLLAGKAEEPVAGGEGRDVCLIHRLTGKVDAMRLWLRCMALASSV